MKKRFDVTALGELLIDFTENGLSGQGNPMLEANPGGAPCNVLAMLQKLGKQTSFIGKVGNDQFGRMLKETIEQAGIDSGNLIMDDEVHTTLAFVHTMADGDRDFSFYRNPGADMMLTADEVWMMYRRRGSRLPESFISEPFLPRMKAAERQQDMRSAVRRKQVF